MRGQIHRARPFRARGRCALDQEQHRHRERVQYGYDPASNRLWRRNPVAGTGEDEFYTNDGLYQLGSCSGAR